jgi:hypothetical protein
MPAAKKSRVKLLMLETKTFVVPVAAVAGAVAVVTATRLII